MKKYNNGLPRARKVMRTVVCNRHIFGSWFLRGPKDISRECLFCKFPMGVSEFFKEKEERRDRHASNIELVKKNLHIDLW